MIVPYWPAGTFLLPPQQIAQALFSPANNLCILAAARVLLRRRRVLPLPLVFIAFLTATLELAQDNVWSRLPDALFSLYCLTTFGWSIYRNLPKKRLFLALFTGMFPAFHGLLNIAFAFNPLLERFSKDTGIKIRVRFRITCFCSPAGVPSGICGGPGKPIGVPVIGNPHCGAPAM